MIIKEKSLLTSMAIYITIALYYNLPWLLGNQSITANWAQNNKDMTPPSGTSSNLIMDEWFRVERLIRINVNCVRLFLCCTPLCM